MVHIQKIQHEGVCQEANTEPSAVLLVLRHPPSAIYVTEFWKTIDIRTIVLL